LANVLIQTFLTGTRKKYKNDVHDSQEKRAEIKALKVAYRMKHKQDATKTKPAQKEKEPAEDMVVDEASDDDADMQPTRKFRRNVVLESDNEDQSDADDDAETQNEDSHQEKLLAEQEKTRKVNDCCFLDFSFSTLQPMLIHPVGKTQEGWRARRRRRRQHLV
jgi:hypothetical protein